MSKQNEHGAGTVIAQINADLVAQGMATQDGATSRPVQQHSVDTTAGALFTEVNAEFRKHYGRGMNAAEQKNFFQRHAVRP